MRHRRIEEYTVKIYNGRNERIGGDNVERQSGWGEV